MSSASSPVIMVWARKLRVPKKNVNAIVTAAPPNRISQMTFGTLPSAAIRRDRRACVMRSS
jgi:hypothetical protein